MFFKKLHCFNYPDKKQNFSLINGQNLKKLSQFLISKKNYCGFEDILLKKMSRLEKLVRIIQCLLFGIFLYIYTLDGSTDFVRKAAAKQIANLQLSGLL
jgi:hypothetical protein